MQLTIAATLLLLSAVAGQVQASVLNHQRSYLHYAFKRGENSTFNDTGVANGAAAPSLGTAVLDGFTTLTVVATEVVTVTSCAPTITNCPAATATDLATLLPPEALETVVVTNTVVLTEVVCPVTLADAISSSVVEEHRTGGFGPGKKTVVKTLPPGAPVETGVVAGVQVITVTRVRTVTREKVLTLTLVEAGPFGGAIGGQRGELVVTTTMETTVETALEFETSTAAALPVASPDTLTQTTTTTDTMTVTRHRHGGGMGKGGNKPMETSTELALPVNTVVELPPEAPVVTNAAEAQCPICPVVGAAAAAPETIVQTVILTVTQEGAAPSPVVEVETKNLIVTTTIFEKETVFMPAETVFVTVDSGSNNCDGGNGGKGGRGGGGAKAETTKSTTTTTSTTSTADSTSVPPAAEETEAPVAENPATPVFEDDGQCPDSVVTVTVKRSAAATTAV